MPWVYLSHILGPDTPAYGGRKGIDIVSVSSICKGDASNSSRWIFSNHLGTHMESSRHFFDAGETIDQVQANAFHFTQPLLIDYPAQNSELVTVPRLKDLLSRSLPNPDLLLVKTSFELKRGQRDYWEQNPGFAPEVGTWLRQEFPSVRAVGIDAISISRWQNRPMGREAHRAFLDPAAPGNPLMIIEDMSFEQLNNQRLCEVWVLPLRVSGADGAPCTIIGRME